MPEDLGTATLVLEVDDSKLKRGLQDNQKQASQWQAGLSKAAKVSALALAGAGVAAFKMTRDASKLNEAVNAANVVFATGADRMIEWSKARDDAFSQTEFLSAAKGFAVFARTADLADEETIQFSKSLVDAAQDMASFHDADPSEVLDNIKSGLAGEAEPLRKYGILLSEAAVKQEAMRMGLVKTGEELGEREKVLARQSLILRSLGAAEGDWERTMDSAANKERLASANAADLSAQLGNKLLPAYQALLGIGLSIVTWMGENEQLATALGVAFVVLTTSIIGANAALKIYNSTLVASTIGQKKLLAMVRLAGPIGLVAAAAGLVAIAISRIPDPSEQAADAIRDLNEQLGIFAARSGDVNAAARELAHARLDEQASVLALKEAEKVLAAVRKDGNATTLQRKQASLAVKQAEQGVADAIQRRISAEVQSRASQKAATDADREAGEQLLEIADRHREVGAVATKTGKKLVGATHESVEALGNFKAEMRNVRDGATQASPKIRDMAGQILTLTERLGRVPTKKEIRMALTNYTPVRRDIESLRLAITKIPAVKTIDFFIRTHGSLNAPSGLAEKQHGGPVRAGVPVIVGEKRPEVFIPDVNGRISPSIRAAASSLGVSGGGVVFNFPNYVGTRRELVSAMTLALDEHRSANGGRDPW